jgi:hypothetical protein
MRSIRKRKKKDKKKIKDSRERDVRKSQTIYLNMKSYTNNNITTSKHFKKLKGQTL